jgi:hypothetical protein
MEVPAVTNDIGGIMRGLVGRKAQWVERASRWVLLVMITATVPLTAAGQDSSGVRGERAAIMDAEAMVERMGGMAMWSQLESVHFVHDWASFSRLDVYRENEILDLSGPRSYVTMDSEIYHRVRAYSPEHRYWNIVNGELSYASTEAYAAAIERAPFSIYRIARGVARGDSYYRVDFGPMPDMEGATALQFRGPDSEIHGWILLNARKEPVVWATTQYTYSFGPLARFGNLWVPDWAVTGGGRVRYTMVSLVGSSKPPDSTLFAPPGGGGDHR